MCKADALAGRWGTSAASSDSNGCGVTIDQCCVALDDDSGELWVMLQAADDSSVEFRNLSPGDQKLFRESRLKEITNLLDLGAYRVMSVQESEAFRRDHPDCVLPSRWVERWKKH